MSSEITVTGLSKTFGRKGDQVRKALDNIDLQIGSGEMVALIGPSGSGKSTLLRHLSGLCCCDRNSGEVSVLGSPIQSRGSLHPAVRKSRARIGYIFQQFNLVGRMKVISNVLTGLLGRAPRWRGSLGLFNAHERELARRSLARVGMEAWAGQRASLLSGGQQQRVAIARTLTQQAEIILADEPIASLDPKSARQVMDILADINQKDGRTVVVTLHQVEYAREYCQRAIALKDGVVVFDGPAEELTPDLLGRIYGTTSFDDEVAPELKTPPRQPAAGLALASAG